MGIWRRGKTGRAPLLCLPPPSPLSVQCMKVASAGGGGFAKIGTGCVFVETVAPIIFLSESTGRSQVSRPGPGGVAPRQWVCPAWAVKLGWIEPPNRIQPPNLLLLFWIGQPNWIAGHIRSKWIPASPRRLRRNLTHHPAASAPRRPRRAPPKPYYEPPTPPRRMSSHDLDPEYVIAWIRKDEILEGDLLPAQGMLLGDGFVRDGKVLLPLYSKLLQVFKRSHCLINKMYRAECAIRFYYVAADEAAILKEEYYKELLACRDGCKGFNKLVQQVCSYGGEDFAPPPELWRYLAYLWFQNNKLPNPLEVQYHDKPPVSHYLNLPRPDIKVVMSGLEDEELKMPWRLRNRNENKKLEILYEEMRVLALEVYRRRNEELLEDILIQKLTVDLWNELLQKEGEANALVDLLSSFSEELGEEPGEEPREESVKPYRMPPVLKAAVSLLRNYLHD